MKKIIITVFILFLSGISVNAKALTGISVYPFSTENPSETFTVKINDDYNIEDKNIFKKDEYLYGNVTKVVNGKRGKRQGYFVFHPTHVANQQGIVTEINDAELKIKVSFYKPLNKKELAKGLAENAAVIALGNILKVPMLSEGVSFIKGVANPYEDCSNRLSSGLKKVYKDSPLSYVEKGEPLIIQSGQEVKLKISYD